MSDDIEEERPQPRRGGKLLMIIGLLAGLVLGGGGVYLAVSLTGGEAEPQTAEEPVAETAAAPAEPQDILVVPVRRFAVPLIDADRDILGYVWVDLAFEVEGPDNQSYVAARLPALRDAYLRDLHEHRTTREDRPGALDFDLLHDRLAAVTTEVVGAERVHALRITNAQRVPQ